MRYLLLACALLVAFGADTATANTVTITGSVKDLDDNPVAGVEVAPTWLEGKAFGGVVTGEDGTFEFEAQSYGRPVALMMMEIVPNRGTVTVMLMFPAPAGLLQAAPLRPTQVQVTDFSAAAMVSVTAALTTVMSPGPMFDRLMA